MTVSFLMSKLETLCNAYPDAEIPGIGQIYKNGKWKYRIYFDSNDSEDKYIEIED